MSQCVPSWDLADNPVTARHSFRFNSNSSSPDVPMLDKEVAELTWENGQLAMHSLGPSRLPPKPLNSTTWDKPRAGGTLESVVKQTTCFPCPRAFIDGGADELVPLLDHHLVAASSATMTVDALVPCSNKSEDRTTHVMESMLGLGGTCVVGCSTWVGSCNGTVNTQEDEVVLLAGKRARVASVPVAPEWSSKEQSASATLGRDSQHVTVDTYEKEFGVGFTSISHGSPENTSPGTGRPYNNTKAATTADDHDSVSHSKTQGEAGEEHKKENGKSSKRSRAAAIHNQSERKRREKINQRMETLQKLVPNSSKTDKASLLDEVIEYLKQLQAQVQMMSRMNLPPTMLPIAMQQQLQMSILSQMRMGMGVMDMNNMGRPNIIGISPVLPNPFMAMASWDGSNDRLQPASAAVVPDPLSTFLASRANHR